MSSTGLLVWGDDVAIGNDNDPTTFGRPFFSSANLLLNCLFHQDLTAYGMADRVLIATWSEFGRRPVENASGGTDHGTAAPVFLIGDPVKGGLYGQGPNLGKLDPSQNVSFNVDFRSVYQEILSGHLGLDGKDVLGASFDPIPFMRVAGA